MAEERSKKEKEEGGKKGKRKGRGKEDVGRDAELLNLCASSPSVMKERFPSTHQTETIMKILLGFFHPPIGITRSFPNHPAFGVGGEPFRMLDRVLHYAGELMGK